MEDQLLYQRVIKKAMELENLKERRADVFILFNEFMKKAEHILQLGEPVIEPKSLDYTLDDVIVGFRPHAKARSGYSFYESHMIQAFATKHRISRADASNIWTDSNRRHLKTKAEDTLATS